MKTMKIIYFLKIYYIFLIFWKPSFIIMKALFLVKDLRKNVFP